VPVFHSVIEDRSLSFFGAGLKHCQFLCYIPDRIR